MLTRVSFIFSITTEAADRASASPHSGGWSESFWDPAGPTTLPDLNNWMQRRAAMLPKQTQIIGYRQAQYTIVGNRLVPGGTASAKVLFPGRSALDCDLPQVSVQLSLSSNSGNTSRITLRGIPDDVMVKGEYQPSPSFKTAMTNFCNGLVAGRWGFVGRNLTNPTQRILSISTAGVAKLQGSTGVPDGGFVRLLHVIDTTGKAITGVFRVSPVADGGLTLTLANWPTDRQVGLSGRMRYDQVSFQGIDVANPARAVVRKIGSPSERYRGRASKRRR